MPKPPYKNKDGLLMGEWDILDTPCGRILKTLVDYGYKIGISSRGSGDVYEDMDGNECVDADTYDFQGFDAVILPAVKAARLTPVTEELSKKKTLQQALTESLNAATPDERKIMEEKIKELNLVTEDEEGIKHEDAKDTMAGSEPSIKKEDEVVDDKLNSDLIENLQEVLKQKTELEKELKKTTIVKRAPKKAKEAEKKATTDKTTAKRGNTTEKKVKPANEPKKPKNESRKKMLNDDPEI